MCREIETTPVAVLLLYIVLAWTPFWTRRMLRFVSEHDFGCEERFAVYR